MNSSIHQPTHLTDEQAKQARNAVIIALSLAAAMTILILYEYIVTKDNYSALIADGSMLIASLIAAWFSHRGRSTLGMGLMLGTIYVAILFLNVALQGVNWISIAAIMVISTGVAATALSARWGRAVIICGFVVAVLVISIDVFWPIKRFPVREYTIYNIATSLLLVTYCVILVRQFANYALRTKLILTFLVVTLIPLAILSYYNNWRTQQLLTERANESLLNAARQTAISINALLESKLNIVSFDAHLPVFARYLSLPKEQRAGSPEESEILAIFQRLNRIEIYVSSYALLDEHGVDLLDSFPTNTGSNKANRDYFQVPFNNSIPYVSSVEISPSIGRPSIYFSAPIQDDAGKIIGVLRMRYYATLLQDLIEQKDDLGGQKSFAVIFSEEHVILANGAAPETILKTAGPLDPARLIRLQAARFLPAGPADQLSLNLPELEQNLTNVENQPYFTAPDITMGSQINQVAVARLESRQPWLVAFFQPQEVFLADVEDQTQATVLVGAGIAIVVTGVAFVVAQLFSNPIVRLTATARQVASGDLTAQVTVGSGDEIGQLAESFNRMTQQLRNLIGSLEDEVRERTADLALSLAVGERAASIRNLDELLPTITNFIGEQFNFYTQIYFMDDLRQNLILRAATGEVGEELLARHHSLPVEASSIVGRVAEEGKSVVVRDTQTSDIHKPNPLLPQTRSEMAVPLIVGGRVMGVIDMQAQEANTFTEASLTVFEAMATQLAISIDSAQQWALAQEAQRKAEEAVRQLTRQSWAERLVAHREKLGFAYNLSAVRPLDPAAEAAGDDGRKLAVRVVVQNETIGQLAVKVPSPRVLSTDEQSLLTAVAQQLGQKAENLRLFEQTQQRATREQLARQIADKVRASRDIESALKTAAEELAKNLGVTRAVVDLRLAHPKQPDESKNE